MRLAALVFVLSALWAGACGDGPSSVRAEGPPATAPPPSNDVVDEAPLGSGSWTGARTTQDGLLITFVGGRPYQDGKPCTVDYSARTTETDDEVRVELLARSPAPAPDEQLTCTTAGYFRSVGVPLERPLGARRLVEVAFDRVQPVFDGATLREPSALPEGWTLSWEGAGYPNPEETTAWSRTWGPPAAPQDSDARCAPRPSPVTLTQGPPAVAGHPSTNGERVVATSDVGGAIATLTEGFTSTNRSLAWVSGDTGFVLMSSAGCEGAPPASPELLVEIARSLG